MTNQPLYDWWVSTSRKDAQKVVPKAAEYGSESLVALGRAVVEGLMGSEGHGEASASEVAIFVYLTGKMARWAAAIKRGDKVSDDTLLDITTYSMMARRIRDAGSWPGEVAPELSDGAVITREDLT